jgi:colanic acid/amylovoran biosynthesis glycosyltransferase
MKIAFIVPVFPSLSQTFVLNQITGLIDRGQEVEIFSNGIGTEEKIHNDVKNYCLLDHTYYFENIPPTKLIRLIKGLKILLTCILIKPSVIWKLLNFKNYRGLSLNFHLLFKIITFLKRGPHDIVHCHFGPSGIIGALMKSIGVVKGKLIISFHAYDLTSYVQKNDEKIYEKLFDVGDLFQPISNYWKEELIKLGCAEEKIIVHRMGVDVDKFSLSKTKYNNSTVIRFLSVARLIEKKGIEYGIRAFAKIAEKFSNVEYLIVGDGPLRNRLIQLIEVLNVKDKIQLLGWMKQHEILDLMDKCMILLAPSITDKNNEKEGIPVVLMEAMAKGLPVISTYHSGIPELVINNKTGLLVGEKNENELVNKIEYLISKPKMIKMLGIEGRKVIEENFNIHKLNHILIRKYQDLVNQ